MYYAQSLNNFVNTTTTAPSIDMPMHEEAARSERPLLIFMMLAVSNSVLDPLIYGRSDDEKQNMFRGIFIEKKIYLNISHVE